MRAQLHTVLIAAKLQEQFKRPALMTHPGVQQFRDKKLCNHTR